ncbi:MAG: hypothetical protein DRO99_01180 [Candidatus Aenigmatarchaeota archaeon]|nr:MAG: hypothetical protein DRO99_01180 [Candidatus Aenigmarchaeota archaeon]
MVYRIMPASYKEKIREMIRYSGSKMKPERFINYSFAMSLATGILVGTVFMQYFIIAAVVAFLSVWTLFHGLLSLAIEKRAGFVESVLPDTLQLMAANSRAGYIPSRALLLSARKEFGPLSEAIKNTGKEIMTGKSLEEGLSMMTRNIKSNVLERTIKLISEGIKNGGKFASLLEENAHEIRVQQALHKEVKANVMMYTIFIAFAGCVGAPVLYAISSLLIKTISSLSSAVNTQNLAALGNVPVMSLGSVTVSQDFLFEFSIFAIVMTASFGGILVGLIGTGKAKAGFKYVPVFIVLSFVIFFLTKALAGGLFTSIAG